MKILQLVSDWKWTGPAEPMLVLMRALRLRGHVVELVCAEPPPEAGRSLLAEATRRGLAPSETIAAHRSAWRPGDAAVVFRLAHWLASDALAGPFDVVHCWHSRDHVLAARALGRLPFDPGRRRRPLPAATRIVRSVARAEPIRPWPWNRWLLGRACDGLLCVSEASASAHRAVRPRGPLAAISGAVELAASPAPGDRSRARVCRELGVPEDAVLIGVVARMQRHRRFDLLLAAMVELVARHPKAHLVVLGRGTHAEEVVAKPARALGIESHVILAGYRTDDYASLLAAMDLFTYLVPGSDGSCRALLEAAAVGLPLVGTRRGAIAEIIADGRTGIIVDEEPAALAAAWAGLVADPARRRALGEAARRDAQARFSPARMAESSESFYAAVLRSAPISSR